MGWKRVGNHSYLYRSRREGGRIVTEYWVRGETAALLVRMLESDRTDRLARQAEWKEEREAIERGERAIRTWLDAIEVIATGAMLATGYRTHRGEWRRERQGDEPADVN